MPTYKGNAGNLMQHWTLCELLAITNRHVQGLNFIDAHAMAPWATESRPDTLFNSVRSRLSSGESVYEKAWRVIRKEARNGEGYPNSAAFVKQVWKGKFSMLLCEKDPATITALRDWLLDVQGQPRCKRARIAPGDWRDRFGRGLPNPTDVGLPDGSLTLISFDPNMYSLAHTETAPEKLYPCDIRQKLLPALKSVHSGVIIQLSTYDSARGQAPQDDVISSVSQILGGDVFALTARVKLNGNMMSLVYARGISWGDELADLPKRFSEWL